MGILRVDKISGLEKERTQNPNLVTNGDFSDSSIAGWTAYNAVVSYDSGAGGRIKVDDSASAGGWSNAAYVINTEPGASYRFEVRASATDSDTQFVGYYQGTYDTAGTAPTVYSSEITTTPSVHYFDIIATGTTVTIMLIANNNGVVYYDDVSFRKTDGNPIGGSVHFRGNARNDNLNMSADYGDLDFQNTDFTFESWVYPTDMSVDRYWCSKGNGNLPGTAMDVRFDSDGQIRISFYVSSTAYTLNTDPGVLQENVWSHVAVVRSGTSFKSYVNGIETSSATHNITVSDVSATFNVGILQGVGTGFQGYISNFRFVRGKAVYTAEFTPPVHELEPIDGTVLLCCNNQDSAAAASYADIGTSKTIVVNGNTLPSTFSPGLTRDFTGGTEFRGVTTFDTQGYFVPPSGTTEQRYNNVAKNAVSASSVRGLFGGGNTPSKVNTIEYITISTIGNGADFGDLTNTPAQAGGAASNTRGIIAGGYDGSARTNVINYLTVASTGDAQDFGDLTTGRSGLGACSSSTRAVFSGGTTPSTHLNTIDYVTIASTGDAQDFGDLLTVNNEMTGCASPTRGIFGSGDNPSLTNTLQYITIATSGNSQDFGDLTIAADYSTGLSNSTRGIFYIGYTPNPASNIINFITISSTGNAVDFGDAYEKSGARSTTGAASPTRGVVAGGDSPAKSNSIEYVTIASLGNGQDFGALANFDTGSPFGLSNGHGGLG